METSEGHGDHSHKGSWAPGSRLPASGKIPSCRDINLKRCPGFGQCAYLIVTLKDHRFKSTETLSQLLVPWKTSYMLHITQRGVDHITTIKFPISPARKVLGIKFCLILEKRNNNHQFSQNPICRIIFLPAIAKSTI